MPNKRLLYCLFFIVLLLACGGGSAPSTDENSGAPAPENNPSSPPEPDQGGPAQPGGLEAATVARIVDGDTVELRDGRTVRYIGLNTPEKDQPYYNEAKEANRQLVEGKTVELEWDVETVDQKGRNLAYIWVDGVMANWEIVWLGFANAYTVPPNVRYEEEIRAAEQDARENERGLWAGSEAELNRIYEYITTPR